MSQPVLISIGSINADLEFRDVASLGKGGTVRTGSFTQRGGGKAANVGLFSHRLGVPTWLIGCVGRDHYADIALETLRAEGMDLSAIYIAENAPTGIAVVAVPEDGEKTMLNASNANMAWDEKVTGLIQHKIATAPDGSVLVADFEIPGNVLDAAFASAERRAMRIFVDPTFPEEIELSQLKRFDTITPNQTEAKALLNREIKTAEDATAAAKQLSGNGVNAVCLKLSNGGCVLCENGDVLLIAAPDVDVVDKTGAGDAFMGALAVALLDGHSHLEAARLGVAAASFSVGRRGAQASYPSREEFFAFISRYREAT